MEQVTGLPAPKIMKKCIAYSPQSIQQNGKLFIGAWVFIWDMISVCYENYEGIFAKLAEILHNKKKNLILKDHTTFLEEMGVVK